MGIISLLTYNESKLKFDFDSGYRRTGTITKKRFDVNTKKKMKEAGEFSNDRDDSFISIF
jgi:hypothetical protein